MKYPSLQKMIDYLTLHVVYPARFTGLYQGKTGLFHVLFDAGYKFDNEFVNLADFEDRTTLSRGGIHGFA